MSNVHPTVWHRPSLIENPWLRYGLTALALAYLFLSIGSLEIDWERVSKGLPRAASIFERMFPPDFSRWDLLVRGMVESLEMAFAATFIGMFLAIPLGLCAASNLVPRPVYLVARSIIVLTRTFHEVIIAIFFVKIFGFGPLAGVLTLVVASVSFIAKMLAEDIENMGPGQVEAIKATGASFFKLLLYGVAPQILPRYLGVSIYRMDANIRHSTVVGIVGAGGIGQTLSATFSRYDYDFSITILACIIIIVFFGEIFSNWARGRLR
ncbi:MAG: phosphonate ABC transporter, permease protein PhnE [Gammaproteobacteria bacterium]|jgi:phosphonate transport system permease protein|nr:phosphonate ABC transporter, permease protein PhnE [Gammaproteobacteria bacterium]MBT3722232.1 phosphonate ABC transporter, permease protein PhnE [Gammaproteobacteria bacterium]MBT4193549.1 phosphonate ABC transporter, permease protein PhnE [Gammaproteobacteria bacterium]MBT4452210.1 phosphonate ABC transporter, permease protein PhnE [Gammaproteobacteria bacterium]MBT4862927.1 phosphonate ABC transporter, permease protein PhnE [Gammaproteobacteria bacterium]